MQSWSPRAKVVRRPAKDTNRPSEYAGIFILIVGFARETGNVQNFGRWTVERREAWLGI